MKFQFVAFFVLYPYSSIACQDSVLEISFKGFISTLQIEIADTPKDRQKGLMFRDNLDPDLGMLFIYETPRAVKFWMKNTSIPLDIAFANETGEVLRIAYNTKPFSLDLIDGGEDIQYVLEINAGMSDALNIFVGSKFVLSDFLQQPSVLC